MDFGSPPLANGSVWLDQITGGPVELPVALEATIDFQPPAGSQARNVGFTLYRNTDDSVKYEDGAVPGQSGVTMCIRRNGGIELWEYVNGAKAASRTKGDLGREVAPQNSVGTVRVRAEVDRTQAKFWIVDESTMIATQSITLPAGKYHLGLRNAATDATVREVHVDTGWRGFVS